MTDTSAAPPVGFDGQRARRPKFSSLRNILALMLREMSTRYGRTPGGYVWSVLEPLGAILFLSVGFSLLVRNPSLGTSFILFYSTGYLPFNLYLVVSAAVAASINYSKALLKFPAVNWFDSMVARFLLNALTSVLVMVLLIGMILAVVDSRAALHLEPVVEAVSLALLLGLGVGALNCALFGLFPLWEVVWTIVTRPLFLASGVIYIYEDLPTAAQNILWYNPLLHITGLMRSGFYPTYSPNYINKAFVVYVSLILLFFGLLLTRRYARYILNR